MPSTSKSFYASRPGFIAGTWYEKDDKVPMTPGAAKYLVPPLGDVLTTEAPRSAPSAKPRPPAKPDAGK